MVKQSYWVVDSAVCVQYSGIVKLRDNIGEGNLTARGGKAVRQLYCCSPVERRNSIT